MKKHVLVERTHVVIDPKSGVERIADPKTDHNVFLLGPVGAEIELERAQALGLVKVPKVKAEKE